MRLNAGTSTRPPMYFIERLKPMKKKLFFLTGVFITPAFLLFY
ncbi:hypothetical protein Pf1_02083 [Flavobacterium columnare]|nr:hypothetical protein Pf1_02083 [Flavobacterium columnare]